MRIKKKYLQNTSRDKAAMMNGREMVVVTDMVVW